MSKIVNSKKSLFEITEEFPETLSVFSLFWFDQILDEKKRQTIWKNINLEQATMMKSLNLDDFIEKLEVEIKKTKIRKRRRIKIISCLIITLPSKTSITGIFGYFYERI